MYKENDIENKIPNLMDSYDINIKKVKEYKQKIKSAWDDCEKDEEHCGEAILIEKEFISKSKDLLSISIILKKLKEIYKEENLVFNPDYIFVNEKDFEEMKKYDKEIMNILYRDVWKEEYIDKNLNWMYLNNGFRTTSYVQRGFVELHKGFKEIVIYDKEESNEW